VACLLFSRSVTRHQQAVMRQSMTTATDASSDLVLVQPSSSTSTSSWDEVSAVSLACRGTILLVADAVDLARGEGLFDELAAVMETLVIQQRQQSSSSSTSLLPTQKAVLCVLTGGGSEARVALEQAAESVLPTLCVDPPVTALDQVFGQIVYVSDPEQATKQLAAMATKLPTVEAAAQFRSSSVQRMSSSSSSSTTATAADIAAARLLGPAARSGVATAVAQVQRVCRPEQQPRLVVNFGELCNAAMEQAVQDWERHAEHAAIATSAFGGQFRANLLLRLELELHELFQEQMEQLRLAAFEDFRKALSKLLISPRLAVDMEEEARLAVRRFAAAAQKLRAKKCDVQKWNTQRGVDQFRRTVQEHVKNRLLAARASGQFKPMPRRGVTVGMHWLLPKPFGNDYRQEPWMGHATDGMVYIPKDKITDVSPDEVRAGDWRTKIVPSPVGNDMIYIQ
jgi:hypothetical protein